MSSLMHHGVKGQRWGVRRYQNKDGTRTAAGKRRNFENETSRVINKLSNEPKPIKRRPFDKDKVRQRGLLTKVEADQCAELATGLYKNAEQVEPKITGDVIRVVSSTSAKMYGLEHRLKQPTSIAAKIGSDAKGDGVSFEEAASGIKDAIRYTAVSDSRDYVDTYNAIKQRLRDNGYEETKCKNYFQKYQNGEVLHKAVQSTFKSPDGIDFEFQFQTPESQAAKELKLPIYNERRKAGNTPERNAHLEQEMRNLAELVPDPEGVFSIQSHSGVKNIKHTSIGGTMYIEGNALILGDSSYLEHHGIKGQKWGIRRTPEQLGRINGGTAKVYKLHNYKGPLYFISEQELDGKTLHPRIPQNYLTQNGFEDNTTERVCFSHDPGKCLTAMSSNVSGKTFNVYSPADKHDVYKPNNITVPDADVTGELWIKEPVKLKKVGSIKCTGDTGEDGLKYTYGDQEAELYDWNYEWLDRSDQTSSTKLKHTSIGGTMYIEGNALILGNSSYLEHHGIRGQRWGVRRFQNRDGSLTNAGRKRLGYATKGAAQTVGKAFKAGVKAGGNAVKAVKAHHEKKEAEKLQKKKEKASKTRLGVMANKDLFTNEEIRKLNERFKLEDEMKMATLQKGVEIAKAVGTIAQNVGTVAKTYEDVTGQSLSPIKRKAAEEKARQDKEDRERRIAREDADEARKAAKEERDIALHEQTLRKAIAAADTQEFTAQKTKAEADSSILDLYKKGQDFNGGSDGTGQSWMEKATSGGKNPFFEEKLKNDPELAAAKAAHDAKAERKQHEQERDARIAAREKEAAAKQSQPQQKQGGGDDDALFSQKGSLPIDKDRYKNSRAIEKAKQIKEDAAEERAKKQDEKAVNQTIDDTIEANRSFKETVRAQDPHAYDRGIAKDYIKGKLNNLPNTLADLNPINRAAKKIADKAAREEEAQVRKSMKDQYDQMVKSDGRDEANYVMYQTRVANLQQQGYSERKAKQIADSNPTFSAKRNRKKEYYEKTGELESTHRKNAKEIRKANKELTDYYYKLINGPGYDPGTPKREALDRKYKQKRGELERLDKDNNEMLEKGMKEAKKILEHSFSIQNGVLFVDSSYGLAHHGVKGQRWGVRRFQNPDGTRTEAGKKHDAKLAAKAEKKAAKIAAKDAKRSAKAEKIRAKAVERYERKASLSRRESEAEAYKLVARDTKKASQKELLSDQKVSTTIAVGQGILGAIGLATYGVPTVAAIAGGAAIVGIMRNYNLETVRTGKTLNNLKGAEKERLAKSRATDQIMDDWREEGLGVRHFSIQNGTLFIDAGEPYLEHHGVKGMKWGKHLMAGKGVDAEGGGGGGFAEDDEKLKEMAKKAGMSVAEYKQKFASKIGGAASKIGEKISVKDKHLVINGSRSGSRGLAVGETGEKPKSFKEKAYNALGGKYKTQAADAHREMVQKRNDADDVARRANAQGRAANANKKAGNVREYMANKEGARQLDAEAKGARTSQWEATKKANRAQWKYDHSIAGLYDKATGKYKQAHKKTAIPKTIDRLKYEYTAGPNSKLFNNGKSKAKTAKEQAKAEVWNAADHQIKAKEYNDVANSYGGNTNYYGQAYKNAAERESRLSEASYRKAAELGKQASSETSTSSRPRARKKKHTSGGSGVTVRRPGRKPVSRTKRVTQSSTGVKRRGATGSGRTVRRGA